MDAIEFIRERNRMCRMFVKSCHECPIYKNCYGDTWDEEKFVAIVEQWSKEHPCKTRQSEFLKQWPETTLDDFGIIQICPMDISAAHRDINGECKNPEERCINCRRKFWMQEVE